ncbi:MAG: BMP family ABC transporter substrate-binding protein, partial [Cellulomonadaceae bacterium]|nr:BMP family ABC transporter substrate-binding protein [Cellulomonadaceae bacterium]
MLAARCTALAAIVALALSACGQAPDEAGPGASPGAGDSSPVTFGNFLPCIVSDQGGFDDRSFNQLSFEGLTAAAEELGTDMRSVQSNSQDQIAPNLASLIDQNCTLITSVGFQLTPATVEAAGNNPDIHFLLIDDQPDPAVDNIKPILYDTAQAAFLAGYLAAGFSQAGKVGTFGGMNFPTVTIFMYGFKQGVERYNQDNGANVEVVGCTNDDCTDGSFTGGFEANATAQTLARNIIDQGVDVILPVGGPIYQSALAAIKDAGRDIALIGVDADLFQTDPATQDFVLTSIEKRMDVSVKDVVVAAGQGNFDSTPYIGTLE